MDEGSLCPIHLMSSSVTTFTKFDMDREEQFDSKSTYRKACSFNLGKVLHRKKSNICAFSFPHFRECIGSNLKAWKGNTEIVWLKVVHLAHQLLKNQNMFLLFTPFIRFWMQTVFSPIPAVSAFTTWPPSDLSGTCRRLSNTCWKFSID